MQHGRRARGATWPSGCLDNGPRCGSHNTQPLLEEGNDRRAVSKTGGSKRLSLASADEPPKATVLGTSATDGLRGR